MVKKTNKDLEAKVRRAVLSIEKKVTGIYDVLCDLSLKLCHIIKYKRDYYNASPEYNHYK